MGIAKLYFSRLNMTIKNKMFIIFFDFYLLYLNAQILLNQLELVIGLMRSIYP